MPGFLGLKIVFYLDFSIVALLHGPLTYFLLLQKHDLSNLFQIFKRLSENLIFILFYRSLMRKCFKTEKGEDLLCIYLKYIHFIQFLTLHRTTYLMKCGVFVYA